MFIHHITSAVETIQSMSGASPVQSQPMLIIVDSVQTLKSSSSSNAMGSVSQIRDSTSLFVQIAKSTGQLLMRHRMASSLYEELWMSLLVCLQGVSYSSRGM